MRYGKVDRARAAASLTRLGFDPPAAKRLSEDWRQRQLAQSLQAVSSQAAMLPVENGLAGDGGHPGGRMFVSFHFSVYPFIYRALAARAPEPVLYSLIGEQTADHQAALRALANQFGFDIRFVESGLSMVRTLRTAIAAGYSAIILLDIPWSKGSTPPDVRYPVPGGCFSGLSTVQRLVRSIDPQFEAVFATRTEGGVRLRRQPIADFAEGFATFGEMLIADPADYERLHQLHDFFEFDHASGIGVTFRVNEQRYLLHADSMRAFKLPPSADLDALESDGDGVYDSPALLRQLDDVTGESMHALLSL